MGEQERILEAARLFVAACEDATTPWDEYQRRRADAMRALLLAAGVGR